MSEKLVTLAIHTAAKAEVLRTVLQNENIDVVLEKVRDEDISSLKGVRIKIKSQDLSRALNVVESQNLFSYSNPNISPTDDGRKRILVPVDFSEYSLKACRIAFNLAKEINAKVKIVHVYFNPYYPTALPMAEVFAYQAKDELEFKNILDKVNHDIQKLCKTIDDKIAEGEYPSVNYSYVLKEGLPEEEIVAYAKDYRPCLIVMGTRGKDRKGLDFIGSVTAEVIEMTGIPILAIPENTQFSDFKQVKNISFLTNFSQRDLQSFNSMMSYFGSYSVNVFFTHIENKKTDKWSLIKLEGIQSYFKKQYPNINIDYQLIETGDTLPALENLVEKHQIDIIALTTAKRNLFSRIFKPSVSRKMLFYSDIPLFVLRG